MIFTGQWKMELCKLSFSISVWKRLYMFGPFVEHQLTKYVLYSAVFIRKVIEDEKDAEKGIKKTGRKDPDLKILNATVSAQKFVFSGEKGWASRGKMSVTNYESGKFVILKLKEVCNWIVHSYFWNVIKKSNEKEYYGFLVASDFDKEKCVYFISFKEWKNVLKSVIRNGNF